MCVLERKRGLVAMELELANVPEYYRPSSRLLMIKFFLPESELDEPTYLLRSQSPFGAAYNDEDRASQLKSLVSWMALVSNKGYSVETELEKSLIMESAFDWRRTGTSGQKGIRESVARKAMLEACIIRDYRRQLLNGYTGSIRLLLQRVCRSFSKESEFLTDATTSSAQKRWRFTDLYVVDPKKVQNVMDLDPDELALKLRELCEREAIKEELLRLIKLVEGFAMARVSVDDDEDGPAIAEPVSVALSALLVVRLF